MSLSASLSSAVSGLTAQSAALSAISENIANSSTTGYKTKETSFEALVSASMKSSAAAGGVTTSLSRAMSVQGTISTSATSTNLAINGSGYFIVADSTTGQASDLAYTRNGSFSTDASGYLVNSEGYYLQGYPTDEDGNVIGGGVSGLETINLSNLTSPAEATTTVSVAANLPADAEVGDVFTSTASIVDSLGATHIVDQTWTKTDANTWTLSTGDPYSAATGETTGTADGTTITITFDSSGLPASISPDPTEVGFTFTNGAAAAAVDMDLGDIGKSSGLTQYDSGANEPGITISSITDDGIVAGSLTSVAINDGGQVEATFSNGLTKVIYQVPVATFANSEGLTQISGTTFKATNLSGSATINLSGVGASGSIVASALEGSTTDTATEFNKMIVAQQAYSAASQVVSSVKDMFDTLISVVR
ncbi:flagellar hook protein FlgE [Brevundimonas sp.]|jgi:flagellar hook protein FlgE|uniref:flagellar hook protein FlgE n=1 Tax=Brevundimonas sp. TaxID=1871086 RepID=UPI0017A7691E|nr:flagellar hook protein FlgE [Brevundimonas sp.]MBA4807782.1 flagellar hook protein FlgE [Brevundimonas sp.]